MYLTTQRLIIRALKKTDAYMMHHYAKKPNIGPMAGWDPHRSLLETKQILAWMMKSNDVFAITLKTSDDIIGTIGFHERDHQYHHLRVLELGYVLDDEYWGLGLMPEAVLAMIDYGFKELKLDVITCGHKPNNLQSERVIIKTGFIHTHFETRHNDKHESYVVKMYHIERNQYEQNL
jgi:RimJ/RimL family protein N-acetyltransferase